MQSQRSTNTTLTVSTAVIPLGVLACALAFVTVLFWHTPGTDDMVIWREWTDNLQRVGLVSGFGANKADYPPLASVILFASSTLGEWIGLDTFSAIKASLVVFMALTLLAAWLWTRSVLLVLVLIAVLCLNSIALGYLDIYFAPTLLLALWALQRRHLILFACAFVVTCMIKWQPLILAPFLALAVLPPHQPNLWQRNGRTRILASVILPTATLLALLLTWFGPVPVFHAFRIALRHPVLSGNALNLNWIITHFLHVQYPDQFGGLVNGQATYIITTSPQITVAPRILFAAVYGLTFVAAALYAKTFVTLVQFMLIGYLAYFTFNTGVHENHLFLTGLIAFVLAACESSHRITLTALGLISNMNLIMFYGFDGRGLPVSRAVAPAGDLALWMAMCNVGLFVWIWGRTVAQVLRQAVRPGPQRAVR